MARIPDLWPDLWRTTVFRLTALYGALFAVGIAALLALIYTQTAALMNRTSDRQNDAAIVQLQQVTAERLPDLISATVLGDVRRRNVYGLFSSGGIWIAGNLKALPPGLAADGKARELTITMDPRLTVRARAVRLPWGEVLAVGRNADQLIAVQGILLQAMLFSGALILVLGLACGTAFSIAPLRRLSVLKSASEVIMAGDLGARLPVSKARDELDLLAGVVNVMVEDIELLLSETKSVGDALAHDLRTPLTRLRALLYRVKEETPDNAHGRMIQQAVAETDSILTRFRALLRISEIERKQRRAGFAAVDLSSVLDQAAELYAPLAEERDIAIVTHMEPVGLIEADGDLLFEALSNLIDNAIKFSSRGGRVALNLKKTPQGPQIEVTDDGAGIPEAEKALVLQRFYRSATTAKAPGSGLGLSIVGAVARLHGFELTILDASPGVRVLINCWPHAAPS